jgi:DNA primase
MPGLLHRLGLGHIHDRGGEVWAECPNHHDSGDSWSINRRTGMHSCFGCGYRGTVQMMVMDVLDCDNFVANRLIRSFGLEDTLDVEHLQALRDQGAGPDRAEEAAPEALPRLSTGAKYHTFADPPDDALEKRHISREAVDHFTVRWDPRKQAWILPLRTPGGKLVGWQEKGPDSVRTRPPGVEKGRVLFGAEHLTPGRWLLVESPLDAVYLYDLGYNAVASFGATVSDDQMRLLCEYADEIVLALDNDEAGEENTARLISGFSYNQRGRKVSCTRWLARVPIRVIRYEEDSPKDVGEMDGYDASAAIEEAVHALEWLPGRKRVNEDVQGSAEALPGRRRLQDGGTRRHARRLRDGAREDGADHRRSRTADRGR